jgi:CDP-diacylglycerol pyrophosphatase
MADLEMWLIAHAAPMAAGITAKAGATTIKSFIGVSNQLRLDRKTIQGSSDPRLLQSAQPNRFLASRSLHRDRRGARFLLSLLHFLAPSLLLLLFMVQARS